MFLMTLIISITAVSAAENSTTSPVVNTHVESNTQNQLTTVAEKEVVSNNKVETNAISKATKSIKTSEVKSTNNDKISNEYGSKILTSTKTDDKVTQTTTKSNNNTKQTSSQTIIQNKFENYCKYIMIVMNINTYHQTIIMSYFCQYMQI